MPIADTPFEHVVLAVATNCTVVATWLLLSGAVTDTPAIAGAATPSAKIRANVFIGTNLSWPLDQNGLSKTGFVVGLWRF
jgi:hypothetical protein